MTKAGVLAAANVVLHAGVWSVTCLEELGGLVGGVGGQELVAPAVDFFEQRQLGARMGFFAAADDAQVGWPVRQLVTVGVFAQQGGELDDPGLGQVTRPSSSRTAAQAGAGTWPMAARSRAPRSQPME
jgi:hypothetical protein